MALVSGIRDPEKTIKCHFVTKREAATTIHTYKAGGKKYSAIISSSMEVLQALTKLFFKGAVTVDPDLTRQSEPWG